MVGEDEPHHVSLLGAPIAFDALWVDLARDEWRFHGRGPMQAAADQVRAAFERRCWNDATGHQFDVRRGEHGDDPACRLDPRLAISLRHPVLPPARGRAVVEAVERELPTSVGLRWLSPHRHDDERSDTGIC
jgi:glycogen debranching enzyme